jgi:TRAP transporter TAXI family solute receptor
LLKLQGWNPDSFSAALELDPALQAEALCDGDIDVMLYMLGHPSGAMKEVTGNCDCRLIPIGGDLLKRLVAENPIYQPMVIPAGSYPGITYDVATFGVYATFFTRADLPDDVAYALVRSLFGHFDRFRALHPAFRDLAPEVMVRGPFPAPLHPAALRYYRESGLRTD